MFMLILMLLQGQEAVGEVGLDRTRITMLVLSTLGDETEVLLCACPAWN